MRNIYKVTLYMLSSKQSLIQKKWNPEAFCYTLNCDIKYYEEVSTIYATRHRSGRGVQYKEILTNITIPNIWYSEYPDDGLGLKSKYYIPDWKNTESFGILTSTNSDNREIYHTGVTGPINNSSIMLQEFEQYMKNNRDEIRQEIINSQQQGQKNKADYLQYVSNARLEKLEADKQASKISKRLSKKYVL